MGETIAQSDSPVETALSARAYERLRCSSAALGGRRRYAQGSHNGTESIMTDRTDTDERERVDHSGHPTTRSVGDLRSRSGGGAERPSGRDDSRGGVLQREPVTPPESAIRAVSSRRTSRVRRLDSRGSAN